MESNTNSEDSSRLVTSVQETIDSLRKFSMGSSAGKDTRNNVRSLKISSDDGSNLDDDEVDLKVPPPAARENQQVWSSKRKSLVPSLISKDMDQIHALTKVEKSLKQNEKEYYDAEQASLMGAVLGIGERNKDNTQPLVARMSISPSDSEKIGTMAGFGEITDQDADLSDELVPERESTKHSYSKHRSTDADVRRIENIERCLKDEVETVSKRDSLRGKKSFTEDQIMRTEDEQQKIRQRVEPEETKSEETNGGKTEKKSSSGILKKLTSFIWKDKS